MNYVGLPHPAEIRAMLLDAGCRKMFLKAMLTITQNNMLQGDSFTEVVTKWRGHRPGWWK